MQYTIWALIFFLLPAARVSAAVTGERSPFYFADDTLKNRKKRKIRTAAPATKRKARPSDPAQAAPEKKNLLGERYLKPGKYRIEITGVICNACTKAVIENLKKIRGVSSAKFDYERHRLFLTIKKPKVKKGKRVGRNPAREKARVGVSKLQRAVRHAGRRVKLDVVLRIKSIREK